VILHEKHNRGLRVLHLNVIGDGWGSIGGLKSKEGYVMEMIQTHELPEGLTLQLENGLIIVGTRTKLHSKFDEYKQKKQPSHIINQDIYLNNLHNSLLEHHVTGIAAELVNEMFEGFQKQIKFIEKLGFLQGYKAGKEEKENDV
jgi:hypothetical protein